MLRLPGIATSVLVLCALADALPPPVQAPGPIPPPPQYYCTAKTTSSGCVPFLTTSAGSPSVSGSSWFIRSKDHVDAEAGLLVYSLKKSNLNFHAGKLCLKSPLKKVFPIAKQKQIVCVDPFASCATTSCRELSSNFGAVIQADQMSGGLLTCGQTVFAQMWQRDPSNPLGFGDNLSDAVKFTIGP